MALTVSRMETRNNEIVEISSSMSRHTFSVSRHNQLWTQIEKDISVTT